MQTQLTSEQIKDIIIHNLSDIVKADPKIRRFVLKITKEKYADKEKTEDRIDRVLGELKRDREIQEKKWEEQKEERKKDREAQEKKWTDQTRKWDEDRKADREIQEKKWGENQKAMNRLDSTIGGLGARWGMRSEASFRDGLKAILEESFNVKVENYLEFDDSGTVFGRPDQVEMDVIIYNGTLILCEIKSSMSNSDMYTFWRKVRFYEERHQRKATRRIVISPMVSPKAMTVAKDLDIEVYGYAGDVPIM